MNEREPDPRRYRRYEVSDGWVVLVGRTERDNDELSVRFRRPRDYWFHAAGCPGSHVLLLFEEDRDPSPAVLSEAAAIAAWHSKARGTRKVPVSMTRAANVKKPRGAPPGQVQIRKEKVLRVIPRLPEDAD